MRHKPHQGASKLTKTGTSDSKTSFVNVRSLTDNTMMPLELNGFHFKRAEFNTHSLPIIGALSQSGKASLFDLKLLASLSLAAIAYVIIHSNCR